LGLFTVHAIVTAHGGTVSLANYTSAASGARITIRLPNSRGPDADDN
jgi:signal transduction histidine kinase